MATLPAGWFPAPNALAGRTILIAGATGGLGRATALACAAAGATVVLLGRKVPALEKLYDEIVMLGVPTPAIYPLNLEGASPRDYAELADTIERECGALHGLVYAAAQFGGLSRLEDLAPDDWLRAMQVNLNAPFLLVQACMPLLRGQEDASVVFVLEDETRVGKAFWGAYGVAKHGLGGLASILHQETENGPVRIHTLLPAPMRTALRRMAYFGENTLERPEPVRMAPAVIYLLGETGRAVRGETLDLRQTG